MYDLLKCVHCIIFIICCVQLCLNSISRLEEKLSDRFDKDFKTPKTRNNYKGDEVLPITIPGSEVSKSALLDSAFHGKNGSEAALKQSSNIGATTSDNVIEQDDSLVTSDGIEVESPEAERERLEEEALIAAVQGRVLLYPTPGFVLKSLSADGNKVFVNVCGSFSVSDVVSTQGVQGCPYMICYAGDKLFLNIDDSNVIVYHAIVHPKYVHAALASPDEIRLKVNLML